MREVELWKLICMNVQTFAHILISIDEVKASSVRIFLTLKCMVIFGTPVEFCIPFCLNTWAINKKEKKISESKFYAVKHTQNLLQWNFFLLRLGFINEAFIIRQDSSEETIML